MASAATLTLILCIAAVGQAEVSDAVGEPLRLSLLAGWHGELVAKQRAALAASS